ncbi:helix-turn-helix transcriptional regulator [Paractinoplanes ovalisporus]|nr:AAA family ATPase [Actinoplanes ovalisporus]
MVGRENEWRTAIGAVAAAARAPQVLEIAGAPGIGKTRLLAELAAHARTRGHRTLAGRASEYEHEVPFAVLIGALDDFVRTHAERLRDRLGDEDTERLGEILDGLRAGPGRAADDSAVARHRTLRALRRLLEVAAEPDGLVLILDDVHWGDPATIDLVDYLVRHPPAGPVVLALAYRPAQAPDRLAAALTAGPAGAAHHRMTLTPLEEGEVGRLLGPDADPRETRQLFRLSGGNPLYVDALLRCGIAAAGGARTPDDLDPALAALPPEVRAALGAELAMLGPDSRLVAAAAAVGGDECEPPLIAEIAELPPGAVLRCVDELVARDVLQVVAGTGRLRFRHPLIRHVVYASAAAGWRLAAHARAAACLERVGAPPRARAHQVARSAAIGDVGAALTLIEAARSVGAQAPATAAEWMQTALRLLPNLPRTGLSSRDRTSPSSRDLAGDRPLSRDLARDGLPSRDLAGGGLPSRAELVGYLADRQAAAGRLADARASMGLVLDELIGSGHPERAAAVAYTGALLRLLDRHEEAQALLAAELDRMPGAEQADALLLQLATYALMRGQLGEAGRRLAQVEALVPGTASAAIAGAMRGMTGDGAVLSRTALIDTLSDAEIADRLDVFAWLCWAGLYVDGPQDSLRRLHRCRQIAVRTGHSFVLPYLLAMQALMLARLGRIGDAMLIAEEAVDLARLTGAGEPLALALLTRCWLQRCAGDFPAAIATGEQAVAAAATGRGWLATARAMLAFARIAAGEQERGAAELRAAGGGPELPALYPHNRLIACTVLAEVAAGRGDGDDAAHWAAVAGRVADPGRGVGAGLVLLARAYATGHDDPAAAAQLAEQAAGRLTEAELLLVAGRAWVAAAGLHKRAGAGDAVRRALDRAETVLDGSGAGDLEASIRRLREKETVALTPREAEIAARVASGRSNADIAAELHLSIRTVETHVSRIYLKLGVATRAAAVSRLARV